VQNDFFFLQDSVSIQRTTEITGIRALKEISEPEQNEVNGFEAKYINFMTTIMVLRTISIAIL